MTFITPTRVTLTLPQHVADRLLAHLFPGDGDEHGAVIAAGWTTSEGELRLLVRDVVLARDGNEYVPGKHGYRMLTGRFVTEQIVRCRDAGLVYLAVHNHGGDDRVGFSPDDLASHARGYPALIDIVNGLPVGALVFARNAVAGRLWLDSDRQVAITEARVIGTSWRTLRPEPVPPPPRRAPAYDRQARLFGDRGQDVLSSLSVAVIGVGGVGSLMVEYLARLGVGRFVLIDPDRVDPTNVPRITGSTHWDAMSWLRAPSRPRWVQRWGERLASHKVDVMRRLIRRANPRARAESIVGDFVDDAVARRVLGCDYLVLAADSMAARLVFNAIIHAYHIPGVQIGTKVPVDGVTGVVGDVFSVSRVVTPSRGCLWCNGAISPRALQQELETAAERRAQRYVEDETVVAPSVITLNATASAVAANDFLFSVTALIERDAGSHYLRFSPRERTVRLEEPRRDPSCPYCGTGPASLLGLGDRANLPTRERARMARVAP